MHRSSVPLLMSIKIVYNPPGFFVVNNKLMKSKPAGQSSCIF